METIFQFKWKLSALLLFLHSYIFQTKLRYKRKKRLPVLLKMRQNMPVCFFFLPL
jgi:hypothetical protein